MASDDAALLRTIITGVALCLDCICCRSGMSIARVDALLMRVAQTIALPVVTRPCAACLETRRTYSLRRAAPDVDTKRPAGTQRAILNFLAQHAGSAYCAACISATVLAGKDIDVAMRLLEGNGVYRRHDRCAACGKLRLVASLPSQN